MATQPTLPNMTTNKKWASLNEATNNLETTLEVAQVVVTSAQLKALHTTAIQLVPAGAQVGQVYAVDKVFLSFNFVTTAYTLNAGTLKLFHGPVANAWPITADLSAILTQTGNSKAIYTPTLTIGPDIIANMCQQAIYIGNAGSANYTLGDGTLTVTIHYKQSTP